MRARVACGNNVIREGHGFTVEHHQIRYIISKLAGLKERWMLLTGFKHVYAAWEKIEEPDLGNGGQHLDRLTLPVNLRIRAHSLKRWLGSAVVDVPLSMQLAARHMKQCPQLMTSDSARRTLDPRATTLDNS